jgi:hypothetical protein
VNLRCISSLSFNRNIYIAFVVLTAILNIILASMIAGKLIIARRSALKMGEYMAGPAALYASTVSIVVESAAAWVLSAILYLASLLMFSRTNAYKALAPLYTFLFELMSVSGGSRLVCHSNSEHMPLVSQSCDTTLSYRAQ